MHGELVVKGRFFWTFPKRDLCYWSFTCGRGFGSSESVKNAKASGKKTRDATWLAPR